MRSNQVLIRTAKGYFISATMYGKRQTKSILVINSATGVKQHFYAKFAMFVAQQGIAVMTYDYHGIFQSLDRAIGKIESNAADWAKVDMEEILLYIKRKYPEAKITLMGHSIGGQMIGLSKTALSVDKIILVTAQNGYWGYWKGFGKLRMLFNWYILFPILTKVFGYMPSKKIMGMENLPRRVAEQWCRWCRHPHYLFGDESIKNKYYDKITIPLTALSVSDDRFAPKRAIDWMTNQYTNATIKRIHWNPKDFDVKEIGHFGVFRSKFRETAWPLILDEIM